MQIPRPSFQCLTQMRWTNVYEGITFYRWHEVFERRHCLVLCVRKLEPSCKVSRERCGWLQGDMGCRVLPSRLCSWVEWPEYATKNYLDSVWLEMPKFYFYHDLVWSPVALFLRSSIFCRPLTTTGTLKWIRDSRSHHGWISCHRIID